MIGVPIPGNGSRDGIYRKGEAGWVPDGLAELMERRQQATRTFNGRNDDE